MLNRPLALLFAVIVARALAADPSADDTNLSYFRDMAETRNFTLGRPVSPKFSPDGGTVFFLRASPRSPVLRLYEFTVATSVERELHSPEQLLGGGGEQISAEEKPAANASGKA